VCAKTLPSSVRLRSVGRWERCCRSAMLDTICPGRKPPFSAVKCPARPYKSAKQNKLTYFQ
jgi:hypothetical protein